MVFLLNRLRFRGVLFVLFIGFLTVGTFVGGPVGDLADKLNFVLGLVGVGRALNLV